MRRSRAPRPRRAAGAALVVTLLLVTLGVGVGLATARTATTDLRIASNAAMSLEALAAAEAGALHAFHRLREDADGYLRAELSDGLGGSLAPIGALTDLDGAGVPYRTASLSEATYHVRLDDNVDEAFDDRRFDTDRYVTVRSRGRRGTAERVVDATVRIGGTRLGVYGRDRITLNGGSHVDSYDSGKGVYGSSNVGAAAKVGSNGDIDLKDTNAVIAGDVSVGGELEGSGTVLGTTTTGAPPQSFPSLPDCGGPWSSGAGISGGDYSGADGGELKGTGGVDISFAAGDYCLRSLSLSGNSTLTVSSGPVNIHLTGDADLSGGLVVNASGVPGDLNIYSSGSTLKIAGGSGAAMTVHAPDTNVELTGGSEFFGTVIAARVTLSGGVDLHVDEALTDGGEFEIVGWHEVRNR